MRVVARIWWAAGSVWREGTGSAFVGRRAGILGEEGEVVGSGAGGKFMDLR